MSTNPHSVPCPHCGAKAGEKCRTALGVVCEVATHWKRKIEAAQALA